MSSVCEEHGHSFGLWYTYPDHGTVEPGEPLYYRECQIMGCSAVQKALELQPDGKTVVHESVHPKGRIQ